MNTPPKTSPDAYKRGNGPWHRLGHVATWTNPTADLHFGHIITIPVEQRCRKCYP